MAIRKNLGHYDVIVIGGGPAGVTSAIAASRAGASTLLVEQNGFLGGLASSGLPLLSFHTKSGKQVCKGIAQEIVDRLMEIGGSPGHIYASTPAHISTMTPIYPEEFKILMDKMMEENNVKVLLHASLAECIVHEDKVEKVILSLKEGLAEASADCFVDATGDADLVAYAGGEFLLGREKDGKVQSMTTLFNIAGVDEEVVLRNFPEEVFYGKRPGDTESSLMHVKGGLGRWKKIAGDDYPFTDDDHGLWGMVLRAGQLNLNIVDIIDKNALTSEGLTSAEEEGRRQILKIYNFLKKYVPGFEHSFINFSHCTVGVRETRRIEGLYRLTKDDVINCRKHPDVIARAAYSIDMHDPEGGGISFEMQQKEDLCYDIPFGCLVPKRLESVIVAGRSICAEHEALASCRVMVFCMGMGEAAGNAAALAALNKIKIRDLPVAAVQEKLKQTGAI